MLIECPQSKYMLGEEKWDIYQVSPSLRLSNWNPKSEVAKPNVHYIQP